ncbi:Glutamate--cysteine ligase [Zhongshania aliphaticivorans]|uniref:Glutamate--cysteine ligase n=1 Tax=Zhongshania aliphaticivorans TaxID=1470434 RepID=A0A5S9PJD2_9GAMM|nr:glutamate--cysteine ligase [Zhongshania aliphaticivorans]CAA0103794.1 Glutamate--cysteine ligase [Zhongshania aliphaticivorans]
MATSLEQRLAFFAASSHQHLLTQIQRGIEKESLRANKDGILAQTSHPAAFGSALTHPSITTDFSEALLEFITPVSPSIEDTLKELDAIHRFAVSELGDETIWNASMPCRLGEQDDDIPVARFGSSNTATMKSRYRMGLGHRYGRKMQTIAGIHYNFSLPKSVWQELHAAEKSDLPLKTYITNNYFGLIRNFRRYAWLLIYLFGAAPAVSRCFLNGKPHQLEPLGDYTLYGPNATSLRMGDLGYQSDAQKNLHICYNHLDFYVETLKGAITTSHGDYENIPRDQQLSSGLLQIENEFYSPIRPKRVTESGEIPLGALRRGGVEYIEVRCIDVNPMLPVGINAEQIRFMDAFLLYCLYQDSPPCDDDHNAEISSNLLNVVNRGREPDLTLKQNGDSITLKQWAENLIAGISGVADQLDSAHNTDAYNQSCQQQLAKIHDVSLTPSAQIVAELEGRDDTYYHYAMEHSLAHAKVFKERGLNDEERQRFATMRETSIAAQAKIEAEQSDSFEDYLNRFYQQYQDL